MYMFIGRKCENSNLKCALFLFPKFCQLYDTYRKLLFIPVDIRYDILLLINKIEIKHCFVRDAKYQCPIKTWKEVSKARQRGPCQK